jgi:hypothetical protein
MKTFFKSLIVLSILLTISCRETKKEDAQPAEDQTEIIDETVNTVDATEDFDNAEAVINETEEKLEDALNDLDNI